MIDYWMIILNLLWILGLALLVAVWSISYYEAMSSNASVLEQLRTPGKDRIITLALIMICAGFAATGSSWWISLIWVILGIAILVDWFGRGQRTSPGR